MKNYKFTFLIILGILGILTSCSLEEEPPFLANKNVYSSASNATSALFGVYEAMVQYEYYGNEFLFLTNVNSGLMVSRRTGNNNSNSYNSTLSSLKPSSGLVAIENSWTGIYQTIGRTNEVINSATASENPSTPDELIINDVIGQAYFVRAFNYFNLVRLWGEVPLRLTPTTTETVHLAKSPIEAIYAQIIIDVKRAQQLMNGAVASGTPKPQMSSCFLLTMKDDSIDGIYDTLKQTAKISQSAGGIGLSIHNIRATGSYISGTNGTSNGIVPMLQVYNDTARYVDQGGGKRKGSFAIYLEPWHADIFEFLDLKKNHGKEEMRARDLFYAMWIPDLFMKRVQEDGTWTLMCPNECPDLYNTHGDEFDTLYLDYEARDKGRKTIKARLLWEKILESQIETGTPYMLYKDAANRKSNQKNLGTIRSSNLCTEIMEYTSPGEVAVCNLASIALPMFVKNGEFDHKELFRVTKRVTKNLNKVIDRNYYPVIEAEYSNFKHRPIGLGIQGLADAFIMLRMPFTSDEAKKLNQEIFETLYFAAVTASMEEAKVDGPYESYKGSPISKGEFQHNMWNIKDEELSGRWDWGKLRKSVKKHGVRNSLLVAPMPTASTSQILGNNEAFEPYTSNIYTRRVLSGEFIVVNKHLLEDLVNLGLWNDDLKEEIMRQNGSVQNVDIPQDLKELYKTVWELSMKDIIDMSRHRGYFIDQSQSLNLFMENANMAKLTSMHFYAWKSGLKTGMYYLRTKSAVDAIKFTLSKKEEKEQPTVPVKEAKVEAATNAVSDKPMSPQEFREMLSKSQNGEPDDDCLMCGS